MSVKPSQVAIAVSHNPCNSRRLAPTPSLSASPNVMVMGYRMTTVAKLDRNAWSSIQQ